jgi:hypothetical protein
VKVIGIEEANLEECVRDAQHDRVVLMRKGKPIALLVGVKGLDLEQIELGHSEEFWTLIRERRRQKTMSRTQLEERLAEPEAARKKGESEPPAGDVGDGTGDFRDSTK